ncbi:LIM homeobox transcription factor 1 alpha [Carabus blaptoides fortunei]
MRVLDTNYHERCLQCAVCGDQLARSCFARDSRLYCRVDYDRLWAAVEQTYKRKGVSLDLEAMSRMYKSPPENFRPNRLSLDVQIPVTNVNKYQLLFPNSC